MNVYVMANEKVVVHQSKIFLQDVADVFCNVPQMQNNIRQIPVCEGLTPKHSQQVVDLYKLFCDWMRDHPDFQVEFLGENQVLVEYQTEKVSVFGNIWTIIKIVFACSICFFGATFTIMAFHNDIGISGVFEKIYGLYMGGHPSGLYVLEIAYSLGLSIGIILFFNHVGGKRISRDPTPVEVAMKKYEQDVNQAIITKEKGSQSKQK